MKSVIIGIVVLFLILGGLCVLTEEDNSVSMPQQTQHPVPSNTQNVPDFSNIKIN